MKTIFKIFITLFAVVGLASCGDDTTGGSGFGVKVDGVVLTFDKSVIQANGSDMVTFRAFYKDSEVTDQASFFKVNASGKLEAMGTTFTADQVGVYNFKAAYKTSESDQVSVSAISREIPTAPKDDEKSNTSFVHRAFFNQHTGSQCPNCPFMTHLIKKTLVDGYEDKVVLAALRNYSGEAGFASVPNPASSWPYLHIDYASNFPYNGTVANLQAKIDEIVSQPAKVGISAKPVYYEDGQIIVKVAVKAAETNEYNVGLWLMQDNYKKTQLVDTERLSLLEGTWGDEYHMHDNCVRVAESKYLGAHVGYSLGKIEAGQTAEWTFLVNVNLGTEAYGYTDSWWEGKKGGITLDDLHFAAFVTTHEGIRYTIANVVDFKYNEEKPFEYKK